MTFTPSPKTKAIDAAERAHEREMAMAKRARDDDACFAEFVMKPEAINDPAIRLRDMQTGRILEGYARLYEAVDKSKQIVVRAASKLGKSTILTYARSLRRLGMMHTEYKALIGSEKLGMAAFRVATLARYIENSERLRMVFPQLKRGGIWRTGEGQISVDRGEGDSATVPTYLALGDLGGVQGFHFHEHYFDDMVTPINSLSRGEMEKQAFWVSQLEDRLRQKDGKRIFIQNAFTSFDTGHLLVEKYGWDLYEMPAIDEKDKTLYVHIYTQEMCDKYSPVTKDQHLRAKSRREGDRIFHDGYLDKCRVNGIGLTLNPALPPQRPDGVFVVHGVDPAGMQKDNSGDEWAIVSALVGPPEYFLNTMRFEMEAARDTLRTIADHNAVQIDRMKIMQVMQLLAVDGGRWGIVGGKQKIAEVHDRYPGVVVVETNGVQGWLVELLKMEHPEIQVVAQNTGANKNDVDRGISAEANNFSAGAWIIPTAWDPGLQIMRNDAPVETWLQSLRDYSPTSHTPDRTSATWLARCGARLFAPFTHRFVSVDLSGPANRATPQATNPLGALWSQLEAQAEAAGTTLRPPGDNQHQTEQQPTGTGAPTVKRRFFL